MSGERLAGVLQNYFFESHGKLDYLVVLSGARGRGLGEMIMQWALAEFTRHGLWQNEVKVVYGNDAVAFYEKYGFRMNAQIMVTKRGKAMNEKNTSLLAAVFAKAAAEKKMTRGNAGIVIYARDIKKFYLCKRGDDLSWCSPAGHPDKADKDAKATAIRECAEESGYVFAEDEVKFIGNILCHAKGRYHESAIFTAELNSEEARSRRSCTTDGEMTAWQWVSVEEILAMDLFAPTLIAINLFLEKCEM